MARQQSAHPYWIPLKPHNSPAARLFCLPYAGGSPWVFRGWPEALPAAIEAVSLHLPGRGSRLRETPFSRLTPLVEELERSIAPLLDKPFALFGHSVGALIGFELARALHARGVSPLHLFVSGKVPPGQPDPNPRIHDLPDAAFIGELRALNGMAPEALESPELLELALPAVRSDFSVLESYEYSSAAPLDCPITAFTGEDDPRTRGASMSGWKQQTSAEFREETFPGDHFFIDSCQPILLRSISRALEKHLRGESKSP